MGRIDLKRKISLIVAATVVAGNFAFADGAKNCITDLKLSNDGANVKVNIYTDKPYSDSVVVNKKEGNKYVILVPETTSSVKSVPKVTGGGNVSVSLQSVSAGNGYTKITIISDKAINVVPKTYTASSSKPIASVQKTAQSQTVVSQSQKSGSSQTKPVTKTNSTQQKTVTKPVLKQSLPEKTVKPVQQSVKPTQQSVKSVQTSTKTVKTITDTASSETSRNKPFDILEQEVKSDNVKDLVDTKADSLLEQTIKENDAIIKSRKLKKSSGRKRTEIFDKNLSVKQCIKLVLDEAKTFSIWKLLLLASAISFPIIVIMVILGLEKKINKKINNIKRDDVEIVEQRLRENVKAVRAQRAAQEATVENVDSQQSFNSMDEVLDRVESVSTIAEGYISEDSSGCVAETVSIDSSDFELDNNVEEVGENIDIIEEPEVIGDSTSLDDFIDSVNADYSIIEDFVSQEEEPSAELVPYSPDGVLADFSNVSDKEFFDELVLQSFACADTSMLPENIPADDIFDVMTEGDAGIQLSEFEHVNYEQESSDIDVVYDDGVTMLNEAKIDDKAGFYLVNYGKTSSLVGHIMDDYFVIKQFDRLVKGNISLKQAEKNENSTNYLVRVGRDKMIVQVNDNSMSRLIDL